MKLQQIMEARLKEVSQRRSIMAEAWGPYINAVDDYLKAKQGRSMSLYERQNVAQCLENAMIEGGLRQRNRLFETTFSDNITFLGVQLPVIAALLPSLVLNQIGIVQALDRRQGSVFYLDVRHGQTKGSITADDVMIAAKTGHGSSQASRRYSMDRVEGEAIGASGSTNYSATLAYKPVKAGSVVITDGVETFTDNGSGTLVSDLSGGTNGTVTYSTGAVSVTFGSTTTTAPTAEYRYDQEKETAGKGVPEVDVNLTSESIEAEDFKLRSKYAIGAAIDLERAHGLILEDEVVKYLGGEIKFELDHFGIDLIHDASDQTLHPEAADSAGTFNAAISNGQEWLWHKFRFLDSIEKGSNNIFAKSLRGFATYIIAGNNVARLIRQLDNHFKPDASLGKTVPTGPHVIGTLDGRLVVQDPFLPTNRYVLGFRGENYLFAGMIYAPYIPLFATPTLVTSDLEAQKGFFSSAGYKIINYSLFSRGDVSGLQ